MSATGQLIYIGNYDAIDINDGATGGELVAENPNALFSGSPPSMPLVLNSEDMHTLDVTQSQAFGLVLSDDLAPGSESTFNYTLEDGTSPTSGTTLNAIATYTAQALISDGLTSNFSVTVLQLENGDTFVEIPDLAGLPGTPVHESIQELRILSFGSFGNVVQSVYSSATRVVCFANSTRIETPEGPRAISDLIVGDMVHTVDSGVQPIRWIGRNTVSACGNLVPIRIKAGALGENLPIRDLVVSQQHRILVRSRIAERMTGKREVLIPAKKMLLWKGVELANDIRDITYAHILLDRHELVVAEGLEAETLYLGPEAEKSLSSDALSEIRAIFPDAKVLTASMARFVPVGQIQKKLVKRHLKNKKPLVET